MDYHAAFNRKLLDFVDDLLLLQQSLRLDVPHAELVRPTVAMVCEMDPRQPQRTFHDHVAAKYGQHIMDTDENFFLNRSYEEECGGAQLPQAFDIVALIKSVWTQLSETNKAAVWQHLKVLVMLDRKCCTAAAAAAK